MAGVTKKTDFSTVTVRELDFVTRFNANWDDLRTIMGITRPIRKTPGSKLITYKAVMKDAALQTSPNEGVDITFTEFGVEQADMYDVEVEKYGKAVSIEAVNKFGAEIAVNKTDDEFLVQLQTKVLDDYYAFLKKGTLKGKAKTWLECLALSKGAVLDKFKSMRKSVTEVVGFVNVMDVYTYLGTAPITVQTQFGLQYVKDFMGYSTVFLLGSNEIPQGTVIATPVENIDMYYVDPGDSDFAKLGLQYTTAGETNLIGFHAEGNYRNATGESYAIMGIKLWAEYIDGICIMEVNSTASAPAVATGAGIELSDGVTPKKTKSA